MKIQKYLQQKYKCLIFKLLPLDLVVFPNPILEPTPKASELGNLTPLDTKRGSNVTLLMGN